MKTIQNNFKILFLLCSFFFFLNVNAQAPKKMSYQAVVRNASNTLVTSAPVGIRVSILWGSATGSSFYTETQTLATNANGLVSFEIGTGSVVSGNFSTIDWSIGPFYIKTEIDPAGGTSYSITGTSQLLTVPYAFYAEKSGDALAPAGNIGDMLYWDGTSWAVLSIGGSGKTLKVGATGVPTWTAVPSLPTGTSIGDMQYWNGTSWVTLPIGTPGQTLKLNASNIPQWQNFTSNVGKTYVVIQGNITDTQAATQIANEVGPNTQFVWVQNTTALTTLDLSSVTSLIELRISNNTNLTSINLNGITNIYSYVMVQDNPSLNSLSFPVLSSMGGNFDCKYNSSLTSSSLPVLSSMGGNFDFENNSSLTSFSIPFLSTYLGWFFRVDGNALPSLQINALLSKIVSWGSTPSLTWIYLQAQTPPAPPTGSGITDKASLIGMGKTVITD